MDETVTRSCIKELLNKKYFRLWPI